MSTSSLICSLRFSRRLYGNRIWIPYPWTPRVPSEMLIVIRGTISYLHRQAPIDRSASVASQHKICTIFYSFRITNNTRNIHSQVRAFILTISLMQARNWWSWQQLLCFLKREILLLHSRQTDKTQSRLGYNGPSLLGCHSILNAYVVKTFMIPLPSICIHIYRPSKGMRLLLQRIPIQLARHMWRRAGEKQDIKSAFTHGLHRLVRLYRGWKMIPVAHGTPQTLNSYRSHSP